MWLTNRVSGRRPGVCAVVMLTGLLQPENSNFEGVPRRKFNAFSRDAYGLAAAEELQF